MDEVGKEFYNNSIAMRNSMCQIILRNYEDRDFSSEESQLDNDRVMDATKQEVKRLIKKVPRDLFDNDDDLPF